MQINPSLPVIPHLPSSVFPPPIPNSEVPPSSSPLPPCPLRHISARLISPPPSIPTRGAGPFTHHEGLQRRVVRDWLVGQHVGLQVQLAPRLVLPHKDLEEVGGDGDVVGADHLVPENERGFPKEQERGGMSIS